MDERNLLLDGADAVYDRAAVHRYLDDAEIARVQLEAALAAARERRRVAEARLRAELHQADDRGAQLDDLTRALDEERRVTWHEVRVRLAEAEAEAADIVRLAHEEADRIRAGAQADAPTFAVLQGDGARTGATTPAPGAAEHDRLVG